MYRIPTPLLYPANEKGINLQDWYYLLFLLITENYQFFRGNLLT